jgi:hypothetical protein
LSHIVASSVAAIGSLMHVHEAASKAPYAYDAVSNFVSNMLVPAPDRQSSLRGCCQSLSEQDFYRPPRELSSMPIADLPFMKRSDAQTIKEAVAALNHADEAKARDLGKDAPSILEGSEIPQTLSASLLEIDEY